jgi:hypothetical protein
MAISVGDCVLELKLIKTEFEEGFRKIGAEVDKSTREMQKGLLVVGGAITAVSVVGLKMVADARKMNAELGQIGITTGIAKGELRGLALELSDVSFGLGDVIDTLTLLSRAGIRDKDLLKATAGAFDTLADATGLSAAAVAEMLIPAFNTFGLALPRTANELDKFAWLANNTMVNLQDFASAMDYVALYGEGMNVTLDDMISIMAILQERGIQGSAATRAFRTAVNEAASEGTSLNEALGISNQLLDEYTAKVGIDAVGATQTYAAAANEQFGIMDKLKSAWEDLTLRVGSLLQPLEPVLGFMSQLGLAMVALSSSHIRKLIIGLKDLAVGFVGLVGPAMRAVGALIAQAAASIWAAHGILPFVGVGLAIAGVTALMLWMRKVKGEVVALAEGGIVTRPTRALIGEAGPEAVIPLSRAGFTGTGEIHIHIGNYLGDEASFRRFTRDIKQILQEDDRRGQFHQVQRGYHYGTSSI